MTDKEWNEVNALHSAAIIAPAGHGKTEMITEIIERSSVNYLILTHTNAGVDAIQKRMIKKKIQSNRYKVETIASFCMRWCNAYPVTAKINPFLTPEDKDKYYNQFYTGTKTIFENEWAIHILKMSYTKIIVDEYQDCTLHHHELFKTLEKHIPLIVLGDPLQGIFGFKDPLVNWSNLEFPIVSIETSPWRWKESNPELGLFLNSIRINLMPSLEKKQCSLSIDDTSYISVISYQNFNLYDMLPELSN